MNFLPCALSFSKSYTCIELQRIHPFPDDFPVLEFNVYYPDVSVCMEDLHFANDFPDGSIVYLLHGGGNRYLLGEEKN